MDRPTADDVFQECDFETEIRRQVAEKIFEELEKLPFTFSTIEDLHLYKDFKAKWLK